jgi:hypothetical protein
MSELVSPAERDEANRHRETIKATCVQAAATLLAGKATQGNVETSDDVIKTANEFYNWVKASN